MSHIYFEYFLNLLPFLFYAFALTTVIDYTIFMVILFLHFILLSLLEMLQL